MVLSTICPVNITSFERKRLDPFVKLGEERARRCMYATIIENCLGTGRPAVKCPYLGLDLDPEIPVVTPWLYCSGCTSYKIR